MPKTVPLTQSARWKLGKGRASQVRATGFSIGAGPIRELSRLRVTETDPDPRISGTDSPLLISEGPCRVETRCLVERLSPPPPNPDYWFSDCMDRIEPLWLTKGNQVAVLEEP